MRLVWINNDHCKALIKCLQNIAIILLRYKQTGCIISILQVGNKKKMHLVYHGTYAGFNQFTPIQVSVYRTSNDNFDQSDQILSNCASCLLQLNILDGYNIIMKLLTELELVHNNKQF